MGKSSVASAVAVYTAERRIFDDGVLHVRAQSCRSHSQLLTALLGSVAASPTAVHSKLRSRFEAVVKGQGGLHAVTGGREGESSPSASNHSSSSSSSSTSSIPALEELVVSCLGSLKILIVLDHVDTLLGEASEAEDFKIFLGHLFESCALIKLLITSNETLASHGISGYGVVENAIALGPLTLLSSLLLFTHLSPSLCSAADKAHFVEALLPPRQQHVTVHSKDVGEAASKVLDLFGGGHPAFVVKLACESGSDGVQELLARGKEILRNANANANPNANPNNNANNEALEREESVKDKEDGREVLRPSPSTSFSPIPDALGIPSTSTTNSGPGLGAGLGGAQMGEGISSAFTRLSSRDK
jgi:hypothetical protein